MSRQTFRAGVGTRRVARRAVKCTRGPRAFQYASAVGRRRKEVGRTVVGPTRACVCSHRTVGVSGREVISQNSWRFPWTDMTVRRFSSRSPAKSATEIISSVGGRAVAPAFSLSSLRDLLYSSVSPRPPVKPPRTGLGPPQCPVKRRYWEVAAATRPTRVPHRMSSSPPNLAPRFSVWTDSRRRRGRSARRRLRRALTRNGQDR